MRFWKSNMTGDTSGAETVYPSFQSIWIHPRILVAFVLLNTSMLFSVQCFIDPCLSFCPFSFGNCFVYPS